MDGAQELLFDALLVYGNSKWRSTHRNRGAYHRIGSPINDRDAITTKIGHIDCIGC